MMKQYFDIKKVMDGIYHINDPINDSATVYSTLIVGNEKALLLDTGYGIGNLKQLVNSITNLPILVVNSHGHIDHVSGNYQFNEVYIHKEDIQVKKKYLIADVKNYIIEYFKQQNLIFPEFFLKEEYVNRNDNAVLIPVEEGYVFDLGGRELEVIHLPGHTNGSIALLDRRNKVLFSGDSISSHVLMFLEESTSISTYIKSLKKLNQLDFDKIIASHFIEPYNKDIINKLINCASHIDISKSTTYSNPMIPIEGLMYAEGGEPFVSPDFVSIVYAKDKL
ncbi:MBL fold metallo-hydrolase [Inediibacterium massiliense]|uniref:MBL fold metallo-hydrolase n=1 Tax=Inediibacterium massiliense TaxID=1658111 RepID=UPI0006B54231|nr:MBL fold metallo-hydrolase [Inediibacterium massiliense]